MVNLAITGASGFAGQNLIRYLDAKAVIIHRIPLRNQIEIVVPPNAEVVVHLAGKAHDLKNVTGPEVYFEVNTELTKRLFQSFLSSTAHTFVFVSSVKAIADFVPGDALKEDDIALPVTPYGQSKLAAENYLLAQALPSGKKLYILRPCMMHGPGNKGNLNLLYQLVSKGIPWPLGAFENQRSFLSIDNFCFVIHQILQGTLPPGNYNLADNESLSTNQVISIIAEGMRRKSRIWRLPRGLMKMTARIGDILGLSLNTERLVKLTENYVVSNAKLIASLGSPLPISARNGMLKTIKSFEQNNKE